ncbi:AraC family transcriptional regulator [Cyclobacterium marinum]|uniref:Transcriptional regulator, AraC family n=1 Tax=Cyclobacterium marinum (strain ATCC 25205 / DSM 745 / LMG 13164 / NCIMB 1802) TaxID=880070 RepID=G0J3H2_CYCMS|nr:AraC family transcriptional regulator [Cyclobacterium marinum]AEL24611.1 transcriptional regulator, AraC family [Cyclobacterium marinum DSM 745]
MKIIKEEVAFNKNSSIKIFSPRLKHYFYWHYHPEIELVYVEAESGISHVGKNISTFEGSELILIGGNVPHLNFDYRMETTYHQVVVQFKNDFIPNTIAATPEFGSINHLMERAYMGLRFYGNTKTSVGKLLKDIKTENTYLSLIEIMNILQLLSVSSEVETLNTEDTRVKFYLNDKIRMGTIYNYIHEKYDKKPDVNELAERVHLSTPAFCRYFKKQTNLTFTAFVNQYRISQARTMLLHQHKISDTCFAVGFESLSYFNQVFKRITGESPSSFQKKHQKKY